MAMRTRTTAPQGALPDTLKCQHSCEKAPSAHFVNQDLNVDIICHIDKWYNRVYQEIKGETDACAYCMCECMLVIVH